MTQLPPLPGEQRRHFSRILFAAPAQVIANGKSSACEVRDLSLKGALLMVEHPAQWPVGSALQLTLALSPNHPDKIQMRGVVVHHVGNVIGIRCDEIDLDSITHLRRLVELNLGDAPLLERELSALSAE